MNNTKKLLLPIVVSNFIKSYRIHKAAIDQIKTEHTFHELSESEILILINMPDHFVPVRYLATQLEVQVIHYPINKLINTGFLKDSTQGINKKCFLLELTEEGKKMRYLLIEALEKILSHE